MHKINGITHINILSIQILYTVIYIDGLLVCRVLNIV